ncbi:restriction endonuclease subunit S [Massilia consociata]|uniref:Restriction endonuclease subunit S n=1 Tax=Massilia consociata TaxID=760117 RepID=A0ABV6FMB2_9BURK
MPVPYPSYTPSGLSWAPQIPEGWQVQRNGRLFSHRVETGYPDLPILEVSLRTGVRVRDMVNGKRKQVMSAKEKYKRAVKGDIAYNMMRMWQGAVGPAPADGLVSPAYVVVKPHAGVNSAYFSYLFRTAAYMQEVNKYSRGIVADRNRLYWESFKQMPSLVPPPGDQNQIVAYLRTYELRSTHLIRHKRELIRLLSELVASIVDRAVRYGVGAQPNLKKSQIDWLGDVPEHWVICRADQVLTPVRKQVKMASLAGQDVFHYSIPVLSKTGDGRAESSTAIDSDKLLISGGELLVSKLNPHKGYVHLSREHPLPIVCSSELVPLMPKKCLPEFAKFVYQCRTVREYLQANARSATRSHSRVDPALISKMVWAWPDIEEQRSIVEYIQNENAPLLNAIEQAKDEIRLVRELCDGQIARVVTGQFDVRTWQPDPEDPITEEDLTALGDDDDNDTTEEETDGDDGHD